MSASVHVDNKGKYILVLGKGPREELGELSAEKCIRLILPKLIQNFVLILHYNRGNSYIFVNRFFSK